MWKLSFSYGENASDFQVSGKQKDITRLARELHHKWEEEYILVTNERGVPQKVFPQESYKDFD